MKSYKTLARVALYPGTVVHLSKAQADARSHALERQGKGNTFLVKAPIEFKAGETFKVEGDLPKNLAESLEAERVQTSAPPPPSPPAPPPPPPSPPAPAPSAA